MPKVALILSPGFADWEHALIGGTGGPFYGLDAGYFSTGDAELRSQGGLVSTVPRGVAEIAAWAPDAVVVVGGMVWETDEAPDMGDVLAGQRDRGGIVAGICGGTLALARAGLLDAVHHTSNNPAFLRQHGGRYGGAEHYRESPAAVSAGRVITAPGTAPASFAAAVFEGVGVEREAVRQFRAMIAAEHGMSPVGGAHQAG